MTPEERRKRLYRTVDGEHGRRTPDRWVSGTADRRYGSSADIQRGRRKGSYSGNRRRKKKERAKTAAALVIVVLLVAGAVFLISRLFPGTEDTIPAASAEETSSGEFCETGTEQTDQETEAAASEAEAEMTEILKQARKKAAQYDYEGAAELIGTFPEMKDREDVREFLEEMEAVQATLVEQDISQITHVFFHILTVDPSNCFSEARWGKQARGYNSLMTTIPEFEKILEEMYQKGFVLVSLHDMGHMEKQEDGSEKMVRGKIMLPPGKQAFVMSEDDVCYYEYMKGAGFADKMIIGEDGKPTLHYTDSNGNESTGDYDLVPILDKFIEEHPDFSYHGHKACLVFTGYNGVLGYRTDETYLPENYVEHEVEGGHDVEAERKEAVEVMKALAADGYDLGCHSWGHRDMGAMSVEAMKTDMEKWDRNVNTLIREATGKDADILIYPKGADIGDWRGYNSTDQKKEGCSAKFSFLYGKGFRYFCNVDSSQYWVQVGENYIRTGRRALDGFNIYYDMINNKGRFTDLWEDSGDILDPVRPLPVDPY